MDNFVIYSLANTLLEWEQERKRWAVLAKEAGLPLKWGN